MELATLTAKGQVTVPKAERDALGLKRGDVLSVNSTIRQFDSERSSGDVDYLRGAEASLSEWFSDADEAALLGCDSTVSVTRLDRRSRPERPGRLRLS